MKVRDHSSDERSSEYDENLREVVAKGDREELERIVKRTTRWRSSELLPEMVELALSPSDLKKGVGRPKKEEKLQVWFDAIACQATVKPKRTFKAQWALKGGDVNRPAIPKFTPAQAMDYITGNHKGTSKQRRLAREKFGID